MYQHYMDYALYAAMGPNDSLVKFKLKNLKPNVIKFYCVDYNYYYLCSVY